MFDTICGLWKQIGDLTTPRGWHKSIVYQDEIYVFGGYYQVGETYDIMFLRLSFAIRACKQMSIFEYVYFLLEKLASKINFVVLERHSKNNCRSG